MNKDKIRQIRDEWGPKSSIHDLCDALLEEDEKFDPDMDIGAALRDVYPPKQKELLSCPACGGEAFMCGDWVFCADCNLQGPANDPTGEKWNALPRKEAMAARSYDLGKDTGIQIERQRWIDAVRQSLRIHEGMSGGNLLYDLLYNMGVEE